MNRFNPINPKKYLGSFTFMLSFMFLSIVWTSIVSAQSYQLTVSAGEFDRQETVVSFEAPKGLAAGVYEMSGESGESMPLQVDDSGRGWFILKNLSPGNMKTFKFSAEPVAIEGKVQSRTDENTITFLGDDQEVLSYYYRDNNPPAALDQRYKRGGYIHPVYSPNGVRLTNHLNTELHPHHLGIWSSWPKTEFQGRQPDFWNVHDNTGKVEADSLYEAWQGPVQGGFRATHRFIDLTTDTPVVALREEWQVRVYPALHNGKFLMFDLMITQSADAGQPLILPEYRYGGVGFRGHADWDNPENISFLTSKGLGREGHATKARWVHIGGYSDGSLAGITFMDYPQNIRHPQPVRIHPDMAFFNYAPVQGGDLVIEPGTPYKVQYRMVTYDGEPNPDELNQLWNDYAYPPKVTVELK
ncbi:PmoA family protein [Gracilimonas mengyeensis]|uniref:Methane oxygenase PmoA n=1 Tax=Gracilimonas mengyeensis TaxID=1302730 RepID=A0A521CXD2_9BACT|nr:PmoA family protein [Gracilimonas mengyeensis]SMO64103.1 Methane oxygenase PmoA [Gracilimonas mengyeensis]